MNKMRYLRIGVATAVLVVIFACTFAHVPIGSLCALCPVGFVEVALGGGRVAWPLLPGDRTCGGVYFRTRILFVGLPDELAAQCVRW